MDGTKNPKLRKVEILRYLCAAGAVIMIMFIPVLSGWYIAGISGVLLVGALVLSKIGRTIQSLVPHLASTDEAHWARLGHHYIADESSDNAHVLLMRALLDPEAITPRIEETYEIVDDAYQRTIVRHYDLSGIAVDPGDTIYLPTIPTPRRTITDIAPTIVLEDSTSTHLLGASASKALVAKAVADIILENPITDRQLVNALKSEIYALILRFGPDANAVRSVEALIDQYEQGTPVDNQTPRVAEVARLCRLVTHGYIALFQAKYAPRIAATVKLRQPRHRPRTSRHGDVVFDDSWRNILKQAWPRVLNVRWLRRWDKDDARYFFGLRPVKHDMDLSLRLHCQSYHLYFVAPEEQYVFESSIAPAVDLKNAAHIAVMHDRNTGPIGHSHIYLRKNRGVVEPAPDGQMGGAAVASVIAIEKPPGLLGITAVLSLGQTILVGLVYLMASARGLRPQATGSDSLSDDLSLLLAILMIAPGAMAGNVASTLVTRRAQVTTISVVMGTILVGMLSIASMAIVLGVFFGFLGTRSNALLLLLGGTTVASAAVSLALLWKIYDRSMMFVARMRSEDRQVFMGV